MRPELLPPITEKLPRNLKEYNGKFYNMLEIVTADIGVAHLKVVYTHNIGEYYDVATMWVRDSRYKWLL